MVRVIRLAAISMGALAFSACVAQREEVASAPAATLPQVQDIDTLFATYDQRQLELSPLSKAYRGIRDDDYGDWGDFSDAGEIASQTLLQSTAATMRANYSPATLAADDALSYRLFDAMAQRSARAFPFREYGYIFDQMNGAQSDLPAFLINIHSVANAGEAAAYIERIEGIGPVLDTLTTESRERAGRGVMPPKWVYAYVISDIQNLLEAGDSNAMLEDFAGKVGKLSIAQAEKTALVNRAQSAWNNSTRPAYERLLAEMKRQEAIAGATDGIWRFPEGAAYYGALLANYTTTDLTAGQIHDIGLREVMRIHGEMRQIMRQVEFEGTLQQFFEYARTDPKFYFTSREDYLAAVQAVQDKVEPALPRYFSTLSKAPLVVKPVEAFREQSAGKAFYQSPAPDGSRPGTYYVNLYSLEDMSRNELEALFYHEGLPGHHLQRAVQTELGENIPAFRRFGGVTAYTEGWGLYAEELGKDMGFYTDPYSDFGRLGMELWRAARLVVDTGIHSKRWSREQAIDYLKQNTPNPDGDIRKAIERYVVYPGQATAYMIGKLKIMELREKARSELGPGFDIREFHDVVLRSGPVPLSILEENVDNWIAGERRE
ncbi:DUF885 domain-containing protein [Altererythrobacter sp. TH136]|uniref:DUF885 domain-containing protein n=1 Tax=Altererythrobacter sp. TH136 TaxID=2067415 RepID=UPI0011649C1A|nr:DUF885 domain-containing protein [Altererythrobacter sp. TH136]QDM40778.1 DUF885 domain-containing protein [Altererythrobacter sp. TH136]